MSAGILRKAAALMRERAEKASTGEPWETSRHYDSLWMVDLKPSLGPIDLNEPTENSLGADGCQQFENPRFFAVCRDQAEHIAAWHPGTALAVAALLDGEAEWAETTPNHKHLPYLEPFLAVARAYLGEGEPQ